MTDSPSDPEIIFLDELEVVAENPEPDEPMQCVFTWSIKNFSHCHLECDEGLSSPIFTDNAGGRWFVTVFPDGVKDYEQHVAVHVLAHAKTRREQGNVHCEVAILDRDRQKWTAVDGVKDRGALGRFEFNALVTRDELMHGAETALRNDGLTISCQLCDYDEVQPEPSAGQLRGSAELRKFSDNFRALYKSGRFSDVSLVLRDGTLAAHRVVLAARSPAFASRLAFPGPTELHVPDFGKNTMDALLSYIYTGEIDSSCRLLPLDLYQAARKFEVTELERAITPSSVVAQTEVVNEKYSYTWRLRGFDDMNSGRLVYSGKFHTGPNETWSLSLQLPQRGGADDIGVYLNKLWRANEKKMVYVKFQIYVLDRARRPRHKVELEKSFRQTNRFGTPSFLKRSVLLGERDDLLPGDVLTVCCDIGVSDSGSLSKIKHSYSSSANALSDISDIRGLSDCLRGLLYSNERTDVTVKCEGKSKFCLHKAVLCARSPKFARFFDGQDVGLKEYTIDITGISLQTLELLFLLIYTGEAQGLSSETAEELYTAASYYEIADARNAFSEYLRSNLTTENAFHMMTLSNSMDDPVLTVAVQDFVCSHAEELIGSRQWTNFARDHPSMASDVLAYLVAGYKESKRRKLE